MQGESCTPADGPAALSDIGEPLKRPTPWQTLTVHVATIRIIPYDVTPTSHDRAKALSANYRNGRGRADVA